ncbi:M48 family metallopeptidase [Anaerosolibacter sp.]|uniref:M48 family metallopeptidase n=1 Tax=Anaerosolibacter sp. TaxID=1872527 RepID=UPI0039EFDE4E
MEKDLAPKYLIHKDEKLYFAFAVIVSIIGYLFLIVSIVGFIVWLGFAILSMFLYGLMMAQIRVNGIRLSDKQFPEVFEKVRELCERMEIRVVPDIYVIESGGALNAFASRFFRKNMVVLYSDVFDLINSADDGELSFIIAHELAHIKRNHISKQLFILPAMWIPFLSEAYSRGCEYTCDRMAAYYTNNAEASMNGLTMLGIGKSLFKKVNRREYLLQSSQEKGFFPWLAEKISTHPPLPKRIDEIQMFVGDSSSSAFRRTSRAMWLVVGIVLVIFTFAGIGFLYSDEIEEAVNSIVLDANSITNDVSSDEDSTIMVQAVAEGDIAKVKEQLESGIDPDIQDADGWTPLMWAAQDNNVDLIQLFIEAGADLELQDYYEETALMKAASQDHVEAIALLIEAGADPNMASESYGWTPLMTAATSGNLEAARMLLEAGANPKSKDGDNFTAFLHAKKEGYKEIADLIKQYEDNVN